MILQALFNKRRIDVGTSNVNLDGCQRVGEKSWSTSVIKYLISRRDLEMINETTCKVGRADLHHLIK